MKKKYKKKINAHNKIEISKKINNIPKIKAFKKREKLNIDINININNNQKKENFRCNNIYSRAKAKGI